MTRLAIAGAAGRMGAALIRCAAGCGDLEVAGAVEVPGHSQLGTDAGLLAGVGKIGVGLTEDFDAALRKADVLIDFTYHEAVPAHVELAAGLGKAVVLGTTGLTDSEAARVRAAARTAAVVWAPNMSVGMNLLFTLVQKAAATLGLDYDAEIVEMHHRFKKDSPSGTALRLAESVAAGREQDLKAVVKHGREGMVGERPRGEIGMHAVRGGDVVGDHTVIFAIDGERLELGHRASSRDTFAMGALRAARWVSGRPAGLYDMHDVLGLAHGRG